jgi:hypothetical protein
LYRVQTADGTPAETTEHFAGQDSLGALWVPVQHLASNNSSPLVTQAIDWLSTGSLPAELQRLDHWFVLTNP